MVVVLNFRLEEHSFVRIPGRSLVVDLYSSSLEQHSFVRVPGRSFVVDLCFHREEHSFVQVPGQSVSAKLRNTLAAADRGTKHLSQLEKRGTKNF